MRPLDFARRALERISRNISLERRLPVRFGSAKLCVSPGAALCYYRKLDGEIWRELFDFAQHCVSPGDMVWDVGASMGVFGFAAAYRAGPQGRVLAVEADSWSAEFLKKSARNQRPDVSPVQVLCAAVARDIGVCDYEIPKRGRAGSHLATGSAGGSILGGTRESHPVVTISLDWLQDNFGSPAAIKMDVEGAELAALAGGACVLAQARPALFIEVHEHNHDAVTQLLHSYGYELFELLPGWEKRRRIQRTVYNTLALPT